MAAPPPIKPYFPIYTIFSLSFFYITCIKKGFFHMEFSDDIIKIFKFEVRSF